MAVVFPKAAKDRSRMRRKPSEGNMAHVTTNPADLPMDRAAARPMSDVSQSTAKSYWRDNLRIMGALMLVWFAVSFGAGILFRETLDTVRIGGAPLGFWFVQQGSIFVFVALIYVYDFLMHRTEQKYQVDDDNE